MLHPLTLPVHDLRTGGIADIRSLP